MKADAYVVFVFDQSGSMDVIATEAVVNYNNFLDEQKAIAQEAHFRLVLFNTVVKTQYDGRLADAPHLERNVSYTPDGWTALYDAMADAIDETGGALAALPEAERPGKVIIVTMTDGQENSSQKYKGEVGRAALAVKIGHQQKVYNWEFVFLGANIDAKRTATDLNIPVNNAIQWESTVLGAKVGFEENNKTLYRLRTR